MQKQKNSIKIRKVEKNINPLFVNRWSPRAMSGEEISHDDLMGLFEAARWAPSSYNNQPWRFIYAKRNTDHWQTLISLLTEGNKIWAQNAAVLVVVISRKNFEFNEKPAITHQFDAGAASESFTLEPHNKDYKPMGCKVLTIIKREKISASSREFRCYGHNSNWKVGTKRKSSNRPSRNRISQ